ncbi:MAG: helix-turn-helix domain-containing protein [Acidobacteriia bacterium]|nr:helix-turn-helix domain-containing protein [Terriglobia bacterium]
MKTLGEFLDEKVQTGGWGAQEALAEKLKLSSSAISGWKRGKKPGFGDCLRIAQAFANDPVIQGDPLVVFAMTNQPESAELYRSFFPSTEHTKTVRDAECVCSKNSKRHSLHARLEEILDGRLGYAIAANIEALYKLHSLPPASDEPVGHGPYYPGTRVRKRRGRRLT